jgi:hypothetical protein
MAGSTVAVAVDPPEVGPGQRAVAEHDPDAVDGDAGAVADYLGEDGVGAGADVLRAAGLTRAVPSLSSATEAWQGPRKGSPGCAGHAPAEDHVVALFSHGADGGIALAQPNFSAPTSRHSL